MSTAMTPAEHSRLRHALRTPLNHILGYTEMVMEEAEHRGAGGQAPLLDQVRVAAKRIVEAVQNSLPPDAKFGGQALADLRAGMRPMLEQILAAIESFDRNTGNEFEGEIEKIRIAARDLLAFAQGAAVPEQPLSPLPWPGNAATPARSAPRILVVDDDEANRDLLMRRLEREGFSAAAEAGGAAALEHLKREKFDLVLLDLFMPDMDGVATLTALKAAPETRDIPVVMLSAADDVDNVVRSIEMGAADFLTKPFDPILLRVRLGAILGRKRTEENLLQSAKLESIGVLAGGIAHDFNNILTGILGNTSLVLESLSPSDPHRELLKSVLAASERAADLTRQMLAFAGKGQFVLEPVDVSRVIQEIAELLQASLPKPVRLSLQLRHDLPEVEADRRQIQQLVFNLVMNAGEAIGDNPGLVSVETGAHDIRQETPPEPPFGSLMPGRYVYAAVADTGTGMDDATRTRIFEPFFTTKFTGRGLGLPAAMGIARSHRGAIHVRSEPGRGSRFEVLLPAKVVNVRRDEGGVPVARTGRTVLVVDDEEIVRQTTRAVLEHKGLHVLLAENGQQGVELFREQAHTISLILLDLTMPVMGGEEAARYLHAIRPDVPILVASGYNETEVARRFAGRRIAGFVRKPFTSNALLEKINSVLVG